MHYVFPGKKKEITSAGLHQSRLVYIFCFVFVFFCTNLDWWKPAEVMFYFFDQEGHSALVQKNYQTKVWHIGTYTKSFSFLVQWVSEILISKVIQLKWGVTN